MCARKRKQLQRDRHSGRGPHCPGPHHRTAEAVHRNVEKCPKRADLLAVKVHLSSQVIQPSNQTMAGLAYTSSNTYTSFIHSLIHSSSRTAAAVPRLAQSAGKETVDAIKNKVAQEQPVRAQCGVASLGASAGRGPQQHKPAIANEVWCKQHYLRCTWAASGRVQDIILQAW